MKSENENKNKKSLIKIVNETENIIDKNISINHYCLCKDYFKNNHNIIVLMPCCHVLHEECYIDFLKKEHIQFTKNNNKNLKCPYCYKKILNSIDESMLNHGFAKKNYKQLKIDIRALKINQMDVLINYTNLPLSMIKLSSVANKLLSAKSKNDLISTLDSIISCCNMKIKIIDNTDKHKIKIKNNCIEWLDKKLNKTKMAIISNHSSYFDPLLLYYFFQCGFLTSDFILNSDIGRLIASKTNLLIFKRNNDKNVVDKMKEYLKTTVDKIGIFPEGCITNNDTLIQFRTGAFHLGVPVCPVIIKFKKMIYDDDIKTYLMKLFSQDRIDIEVYVSDLIYPPFDNEKIEKIRKFMAKVGGLDLSRVTNRFSKD